MTQLAIRGHKERGNEVIEILEMLGAINSHNLYGDENYAYYTIDGDKEIKGGIYVFGDEQLCYFTLEEFLEKFPYKVGNKVNYVKYNDSDPNVYTIQKMRWTGATIEYLLDSNGFSALTKDLQPYKEETIKEEEENFAECIRKAAQECLFGKEEDIEEIKVDIPKGYEFAGIDDDNQQVVFTKIKPEYPKTYEECRKIIGIEPWNTLWGENSTEYEEQTEDLIDTFIRLKVCRDAYWKIAGEQMGLGKPWEPDWNSGDQERYGIIKLDDNGYQYAESTSFTFPTKEMRDAFYDNFKELIECCKELL